MESGITSEPAFRKVAEVRSERNRVELAEEMMLTTAEMSFLSDRRKAYENLGLRTGLEGVKAKVTAAIQADPLRHAARDRRLRTLAQENRDMRMADAEKKAAALPPKLTVPMIVFFLPALFIVIMGPAIDPDLPLDEIRQASPIRRCSASGIQKAKEKSLDCFAISQ